MKTCLLVSILALAAAGASAESKTEPSKESAVSKQSTEKGIVMSGGSTMYEGVVAQEKQGIVMSGGSTMYEGIKADK